MCLTLKKLACTVKVCFIKRRNSLKKGKKLKLSIYMCVLLEVIYGSKKKDYTYYCLLRHPKYKLKYWAKFKLYIIIIYLHVFVYFKLFVSELKNMFYSKFCAIYFCLV